MTTCKVRVLGVCKTRVTEEGETGTDSSLLGGPFYFHLGVFKRPSFEGHIYKHTTGRWGSGNHLKIEGLTIHQYCLTSTGSVSYGSLSAYPTDR